jgi:hypothetical protein
MEPGVPVEAHAIAVESRRFFIVTAARTGSTLLSAILADAGADFGMTAPPQWNRAGGDLEHPELWRALQYFSDAERISMMGRPGFGLSRMRWNIYRSLGKRRLRAGLDQVRFAKVYGAHKLVRPAFKIGYFPTIILSYRRIEDQALSLGLMHAHANWEFARDNYLHIYGNGLWLLNMFGGCVVGYDDILSRTDTAWAAALARTTGLPAARLIEARGRRVEDASPAAQAMWFDRSAAPMFEAIQALRGMVIPPSQQALRQWHGSRGADDGLVRPFELPPRAINRLPRTEERFLEAASAFRSTDGLL